MIFLPLLIAAIIFYFTDKRVLSVLIFFFFFCNGFQMVPEKLFDTGMVITKPMDFALFYILGIVGIGMFKYRDFIKKGEITTWIFIFLGFIIALMLYNKYQLGIGWNEILRTSRNFFFMLSIFVFWRLTQTEIRSILKTLLYITLFLCSLYVVQAFIGIPLLSGADRIGTFGKINRYYNIPILYFFFLSFVLLANPLRGFMKYVSIGIFILVTIVSLHRTLMIAIFLLTFLGIFLKGGFKGVIKYVFIGGLILVPFLEKMAERFEDKSVNDIQSVMEGGFQDYGNEINIDGTFLFRIALFYERFEYVRESPLHLAIGVGFMTEDSPITKNTFDFKIGLTDDNNEVNQLDTGDIAWVNFMLRLGIIGTILFLIIYIIMGKFFYRHRKNNIALASFIYILFLVSISLTSSLFYNTEIIVPIFLVMTGMLNYADKETDFLNNGATTEDSGPGIVI